ncbi:MAG: hypothetical protein ACHRXM_27490 [Isosphaerales bacterium]
MHTPAELARQVEQLDEEDWFDFLDRLDDVSRRRRLREPESDGPAGTTRDEVAAWLAKQHFIADSSIREVWYLPRGAPPDEIRLLELNDRLAGPEGPVQAIDFGLNIEGVPFHMLVADVTTEELDQVKQDPSRLPSGWSLEGHQIWRRRG